MYCLLYQLLNKKNLWLVTELSLDEMREHVKNMHDRKYFGDNDKYWIVERNYEKGIYLNTYNNYTSKVAPRLFDKDILQNLKVVDLELF